MHGCPKGVSPQRSHAALTSDVPAPPPAEHLPARRRALRKPGTGIDTVKPLKSFHCTTHDVQHWIPHKDKQTNKCYVDWINSLKSTTGHDYDGAMDDSSSEAASDGYSDATDYDYGLHNEREPGLERRMQHKESLRR